LRLGIISLADLGDYFRHFYTITTFLRGKSRLSEAEQSRAFVRGFQPDLWSRILQRLQLKLPDHFPDDPYTLDEIHKAARFVLHGTPANILTLSTSLALVLPRLGQPRAGYGKLDQPHATASIIACNRNHDRGFSTMLRFKPAIAG
jgi:hypothetical protein